MRCLQVAFPDGPVRLGLQQGGRVRVLTRAHEGIATTLDLLAAADERGLDPAAWSTSAEEAGAFEGLDGADLAAGRLPLRLALPLTPPEVWGAGVTYKRSADFREEGSGIYDAVYHADRPELFFKATAARCAAPGQPIGRRRDSRFTATEPELAVVVGARGSILGFTLANDVSAWDIERENPLYLPQSKVYDGCFAFGPVIVTPDEVEDPLSLELQCRVERGGREVFAGRANTRQLKRSLPELVEWLRRCNGVPAGTLLSTGTGIIQPLDAGLEEGDVVTISCPEIGLLRNPVALV
ncbi:MAG TPA: fumarylacetoacetate hydrolase family protein [Vicinamibacteria bacterium]|nr:fumarylacetoacetate hydrolase family protein [Vicinamibacteria bacterium]